MRLLVIVIYHEFSTENIDNIIILNNYMKQLNIHVDYCGISSQHDFSNYESIIQFKYKIVNTKKQLTKLCDFITDYKSELNYDWYMKIRPDVKLLENIRLDISQFAINARARVYNGPQKIKYGLSVGGKGAWESIQDCSVLTATVTYLTLDDMLFIFHHNVINMGGFDKIETTGAEHEWTQTEIYCKRNIPLNVIGIHLENTKYKACSGHINIRD